MKNRKLSFLQLRVGCNGEGATANFRVILKQQRQQTSQLTFLERIIPICVWLLRFAFAYHFFVHQGTYNSPAKIRQIFRAVVSTAFGRSNFISSSQLQNEAALYLHAHAANYPQTIRARSAQFFLRRELPCSKVVQFFLRRELPAPGTKGGLFCYIFIHHYLSRVILLFYLCGDGEQEFDLT